jgi:cytochrome c-type biogenesis protein CcmH
MSDSLAALRGQLQELESRKSGGAIGMKEYEQERGRIERALAELVLAQGAGAAAAGAAGAAVAAEPAPRPPTRLVALVSLAVLAIAVAGYAVTGSPELATGKVPVAQGEGAPHEAGAEQFAAAVERLAERLKEQPDNAEGWAMLARSYVQLGRLPDAVPAFRKAVSLATDDARLLADYADALAVQNNRSLDGEPAQLIERALKIEPDNLKALALAGTAAYNRKDYAAAVKHWERMAQVAPPDSPWRDQLMSSIAEARQLGGLGRAAPAQAAAATAQAASPPSAAGAASVRGTVRLAPALAAQARPDDTVFIVARAAEGPRIPLAVLRKQVKDLPFDFTLDDSLAMQPAMRISAFPRIVVDARVSKSGQAQPAAGDLAGRSAPVANDTADLVIEISEVVKP